MPWAMRALGLFHRWRSVRQAARVTGTGCQEPCAVAVPYQGAVSSGPANSGSPSIRQGCPEPQVPGSDQWETAHSASGRARIRTVRGPATPSIPRGSPQVAGRVPPARPSRALQCCAGCPMTRGRSPGSPSVPELEPRRLRPRQGQPRQQPAMRVDAPSLHLPRLSISGRYTTATKARPTASATCRRNRATPARVRPHHRPARRRVAGPEPQRPQSCRIKGMLRRAVRRTQFGSRRSVRAGTPKSFRRATSRAVRSRIHIRASATADRGMEIAVARTAEAA